jgi:tetratricopeptide (TPR) repeat protein
MIAAIAALIVLTVVGEGQQAATQRRIDAIWSAADDRMSQQLDVWFEAGEYPMCIQLLRMQYDLSPHNYEVATNLGWMYENTEQWDPAVAIYEQYLRENPGDPDARLPLAQYWYLKKQYAKVPPILEGHLADKAHPNNFRILAHSYERLNRLKDSVALWKRYLALHPDDETGKNNLARVEKKLAGG